VRVVLLVEDDTMGDYLHFRTELETFRIYIRMYTVDKSTKRWIFTSLKIDEPLGPRFHFEKKKFWEPMSVGVRVILLVEDNTMGKYLHPYIESGTLRAYACMYTTDKSMKRLTLTPLKIDEPFGARF
jgi:hypothetical protein